MKQVIAGICVTMLIIGFESATGIELSFAQRMLILIPLCILTGMIIEE
jgi:hypothetical protein